MTKQEFLKALEDLKQKAEASNAFDEPSVPWKPENRAFYYLINSYGKVECGIWNEEDKIDALRNGNVFKTREQAEKFAKKRAARNRLELIALRELPESLDIEYCVEHGSVRDGAGACQVREFGAVIKNYPTCRFIKLQEVE